MSTPQLDGEFGVVFLTQGPYKPMCRDCAIYFSITVSEEGFCIFLAASKCVLKFGD